jgi:hypothetical protein
VNLVDSPIQINPSTPTRVKSPDTSFTAFCNAFAMIISSNNYSAIQSPLISIENRTNLFQVIQLFDHQFQNSNPVKTAKDKNCLIDEAIDLPDQNVRKLFEKLKSFQGRERFFAFLETICENRRLIEMEEHRILLSMNDRLI